MINSQLILFWVTYPIFIISFAALFFGGIFSPFYIYSVCKDKLDLQYGIGGLIAAIVSALWAYILFLTLPLATRTFSNANLVFFEKIADIPLVLAVSVILIPWSPFLIERIFFPFKFNQNQSTWFSRLRIYIVMCMIGMVLGTWVGDDHCGYESLPGGRMVPTNPMCW